MVKAWNCVSVIYWRKEWGTDCYENCERVYDLKKKWKGKQITVSKVWYESIQSTVCTVRFGSEYKKCGVCYENESEIESEIRKVKSLAAVMKVKAGLDLGWIAPLGGSLFLLM